LVSFGRFPNQGEANTIAHKWAPAECPERNIFLQRKKKRFYVTMATDYSLNCTFLLQKVI
jgi:hypothetical protein